MTATPDPLRVFFDAHKHRVLRYLRRVLPNAQAAEDVAQEAFRVLFAKWLKDGPMQDPANFLFQLAHHRMCNWWRHHNRTREELTDFINPGRETAEAILQADTEFTDHVVSKVDLTHALQRLPVRQRQVLALRFHDELTVEEAAAVMGVSPSGVKKATAAAVKALRESPLLLGYTRMGVHE